MKKNGMECKLCNLTEIFNKNANLYLPHLQQIHQTISSTMNTTKVFPNLQQIHQTISPTILQTKFAPTTQITTKSLIKFPHLVLTNSPPNFSQIPPFCYPDKIPYIQFEQINLVCL